MLTSRYDLFIGIGIGAGAVIIFVLLATIIFCRCCVPSASHRYFGRSVRQYAAINSIDAKTYFKPPQLLVSRAARREKLDFLPSFFLNQLDDAQRQMMCRAIRPKPRKLINTRSHH